MQTVSSSTHQQAHVASTLDFRDNNTLIMTSHLLRVLGAGLFAGLFYMVADALHPNAALSLTALVTIAIEGVPGIVSIIMIAAVVIFVLWLHELIHASVFFIHTGAAPSIGFRGSMIFASAKGHLNTRYGMMANALAPFVVISGLGLLLMWAVPVSLLAWIFIPTVANAAAAAGDFMAVVWLWRLPNHVQIEDHGDLLMAYTSQTHQG